MDGIISKPCTVLHTLVEVNAHWNTKWNNEGPSEFWGSSGRGLTEVIIQQNRGKRGVTSIYRALMTMCSLYALLCIP